MNDSNPEYKIPAYPVAVLKLLKSLSGTNSLKDISSIIQEDVGLSAKLLSVANSPIYRSHREIDTIGHVVSWLGKEKTTEIALSVSMSSLLGNQKDSEKSFRKLWLRSFVQGIAMEEIAYLTKRWNPSKAYISGLLMDIGQFAQLASNAEAYTQFHSGPSIAQSERLQHEAEQFGKDYVSIGSEIATIWELPGDISTVVGQHLKTLSEIEVIEDPDQQALVSAACMANHVGNLFTTDFQADSLICINEIANDILDISRKQVTSLVETVENRADEKSHAYDVDLRMLPTTESLIAITMEQITSRAIQKARASTSLHETQALQQECDTLREQLREPEVRTCRDALTKCYNKTSLQSRFDERIRISLAPLGLLMVHIDDLETVNNNQGKGIGDQLLSVLANQLLEIPGEETLACRYGGDEFMLLLNAAEEEQLIEIGQQLLRDFGSRWKQSHRDLPVTLSIGGTIYHPQYDEIKSREHIVREAELAMSQAQESGGNQITLSGQLPEGAWPISASV